MSSLLTRLGARVAAAGFGALARARHDRALHPNGVVLQATTTFGQAVPGISALDGPRAVDSLVRLSRAIGLPGPVPDVLGMALRLHDLHGPGRHQDLLLASSPPPPFHVVLAPARNFHRTWFTGLLPYRVGDRRGVLVAHALDERRFSLGMVQGLSAAVTPVAEIRLTERLDPPPAEALSFDPILHAAAELRQDAGPLNVIRERAYRASRIAGAGRRG